MILIILASGRGSRLDGLTSNKPKCLVKIKREKTIINYLEDTFKLFKKIIIVSGYKSKLLEKKFKNNKKIIIVKNKKFKTTNMVYSSFVPSKYVDNDVVITYSDIIYNKEIIVKLKKMNGLVLPLKSDWLKVWKLRMSKNQIYKDAENILLNKKYITSIGGKINKKLPRAQYMGILKIPLKKYIKMKQIFFNKKNYRIDMTNFINFLIRKKNFKFSYFRTKSKWYEFDTKKDIKNFKKITF